MIPLINRQKYINQGRRLFFPVYGIERTVVTKWFVSKEQISENIFHRLHKPKSIAFFLYMTLNWLKMSSCTSPQIFGTQVNLFPQFTWQITHKSTTATTLDCPCTRYDPSMSPVMNPAVTFPVSLITSFQAPFVTHCLLHLRANRTINP